jgi:tetratricopeptide (TPR) repeat protein
MSEMLGNQYFMARNYKEAARELEPVYLKNIENKQVRRKLILAYLQTGKLLKSLELFIELVKEDVNFIAIADPIYDDCPCSELITEIETVPKEQNSPDSNLYCGILWLYCDPKISIEFLKKAAIDFPENLGLKNSIIIIGDFIQNELDHKLSHSN